MAASALMATVLRPQIAAGRGYSTGPISRTPTVGVVVSTPSGGSQASGTASTYTPGLPNASPQGTGATPANANAGSPSLASILGPGYDLNAGGDVGPGDAAIPNASDVAALQPTPATTTSSGPSTIAIVVVVALLAGVGIWWYMKHKKAKGGSENVE